MLDQIQVLNDSNLGWMQGNANECLGTPGHTNATMQSVGGGGNLEFWKFYIPIPLNRVLGATDYSRHSKN